MKTIIPLLSVLILFSCKSNRELPRKTDINQTNAITNANDRAHLIVYKTKADYNNYIPVILSDNKIEIISYPAPSDVVSTNKLLKPTPLNNGYLLDNKGINRNVAFVKITYEEYAKFQNVPSLKELLSLIIDKNPLLEIYDCGIRTNLIDDIKKINNLIDRNKLQSESKLIK